MEIYITTDGEHHKYGIELLKAGFISPMGVDVPNYYSIGTFIYFNGNEIKIECNKRNSNTKTATDLAVKHLKIEKTTDKQGDQIDLESLFEE